jgi:hypothetical protein
VSEVRAWRPVVPGLTEVLHASFTDHVYPSHTHDAWTLLLVDDGAVRYDLDRHAHDATCSMVTLLPPGVPPGVPHDGRSESPAGFRKRVLYLEPDTLRTDRVGHRGRPARLRRRRAPRPALRVAPCAGTGRRRAGGG